MDSSQLLPLCPVAVPGSFVGFEMPSSSAARLGCPISSLPTMRLRQLSTPAHTYAPLYLSLAARSNVAAATRFVKAQATMLHFPQAENSDCTLAFPLPTKQALRGPRFSLPPAALPSLPPGDLRCKSHRLMAINISQKPPTRGALSQA